MPHISRRLPRARAHLRSSAGYRDALGRGGVSGCDVPTDWLGVVPRGLADVYFAARDSLRRNPEPQTCAALRSQCYCHDSSQLQPECLLGGHLVAHGIAYGRRDFGLLALARRVLPSPAKRGGTGVFTESAIMGDGININECAKESAVLSCPRFCARASSPAAAATRMAGSSLSRASRKAPSDAGERAVSADDAPRRRRTPAHEGCVRFAGRTDAMLTPGQTLHGIVTDRLQVRRLVRFRKTISTLAKRYPDPEGLLRSRVWQQVRGDIPSGLSRASEHERASATKRA